MQYLGGSELVAAAVRRGEFDMGIVKTSAVAAELADGSLRVVQRVSALTRPWVVRGGFDAATMDQLRGALVGFDDTAALSSLAISGFIGVNEDHDAARSIVEAGEDFVGMPSSVDAGPAGAKARR